MDPSFLWLYGQPGSYPFLLLGVSFHSISLEILLWTTSLRAVEISSTNLDTNQAGYTLHSGGILCILDKIP